LKGQKFESKILGGAKFWETMFSDNILKKFEKKFPLFSKIFDDLFQKFTPFIQNLLPFLCISLSLSLFLLSFMFSFFK